MMKFIIPVSKQFLMNIYIELGTVLGAEYTMMRKTDMILPSLNLQSNEGYKTNNYKNM